MKYEISIEGLITIIISVLGGLYYLIRKISNVELKTNTLWDFVMRRALSEAVNKGLGTINSPFKFNEEVLKLGEPIANKIKDDIKNLDKYSNTDLYNLIQNKYGQEIYEKITNLNSFPVGTGPLIIMSNLGRNVNDFGQISPK